MSTCTCPHCGHALQLTTVVEDDRDLEPIPERDYSPAVWCHECHTFGHDHSRTCPYRGMGMKHHVTIPKQL